MKNLKELIENASKDKETVIDELSKGYKNLIWDKELYTFNIEKEVKSKELHNLETFKASCLNTKLPKFKGSDSAMDIFTFQSTFKKLYEKRTPRKMLPDLLINNYLGDPALSLVKRVKVIMATQSRCSRKNFVKSANLLCCEKSKAQKNLNKV